MYDIPKKVHKIAKTYGLIVEPSRKGQHKIDVYDIEGKYIASIGHKKYKDYWIYKEENGKEYAMYRRELYYKRHEKGIDAGYRKELLSALLLWDIRV
jgi:hypothetical protein